MRFLLKDTSGKYSASYTMAMTAFLVVTLWLVLSIFSKIGRVEIREFSGSEAMSFLTPILLLYFGRRHTEKTLTGTVNDEPATSTEQKK